MQNSPTSPERTPPQLPTPPDWRMEPELAQPQPRRRWAEFNEYRGDPGSAGKFWSGLTAIAVGFYLGFQEPPGKSRQDFYLFLGPVMALMAWMAFKGARDYFRSIRRNRDFYQYGQPFAGRVTDLQIIPVSHSHGTPDTYAHVAEVEGPDPATGQPASWSFSSRQMSIMEYRRYAFSFLIGDPVTLLFHPHHGVTLYALMGIRPDIGLLPKPNADDIVKESRRGLFIVAATYALLMGPPACILRWGDKYLPLAPPQLWSILPWALTGGTLGLLVYRRFRRKFREEIEEYNKERQRAQRCGEAMMPAFETLEKPAARVLHKLLAHASSVLLPLFAAGEMVLVGCYLNGKLDRSAPSDIPVIVDRVHDYKEHRTYYYYFPSEPGQSHFLERPYSQVIPIQPGPAVAELRAGRFGMPWVGHLRQESATTPP